MELYSKVKLIRKDISNTFYTGDIIAYHTGYVISVENNEKYSCLYVIYNQRGKTRIIRLNKQYWKEENLENDIYKYYDNDNNTVIYYHKTISKTPSNEKNALALLGLGLQYEIEKHTKLENISNFVFIGENSKNEQNCIIDDFDLDRNSKEYSDLLTKSKIMLYAYKLLNGFNSDKSMKLFRYILKGYDADLISSFIPILTKEEIENINKIISKKREYVQNGKYEEACTMRDYEKSLINYHISKLLTFKLQ